MGVTYFGGWVLTRTYPLFEPLIAWHHKKYVGPIHPDSLGLSLDFTFIISCFVTGAFLGGIVASVISRQEGLLFALLVPLSVGAGPAAMDFPGSWSELSSIVITATSALIGFYFAGRLRHDLKRRTTIPSVETISNHESKRQSNC